MLGVPPKAVFNSPVRYGSSQSNHTTDTPDRSGNHKNKINTFIKIVSSIFENKSKRMFLSFRNQLTSNSEKLIIQKKILLAVNLNFRTNNKTNKMRCEYKHQHVKAENMNEIQNIYFRFSPRVEERG
eukprot:c20687_g2_i14.p1 GENE.c20687_g2_i14~~c20687_g2_i14.p1  ORF type:complete len:127 (-),score=14.23 c20687_g2_i14:35-415(-)